MRISRRDFLKAAAAAVAAGHLTPAAFADLREGLRAEGGPRVVWLQGSGCAGCAVSLMNTIRDASFDSLLQNTIDLEFQPNVMAATGALAVSAAQAAVAEPGYILVIEGAIPVGSKAGYCVLWPGMTMYNATMTYSQDAAHIVTIGTCAAYGGVTAGSPNPSSAAGAAELLAGDPRLIAVPGCPAHPDRVVGTLAYLIAYGHAPPLDAYQRPTQYFGKRIHDNCFNRATHCGQLPTANQLGDSGCLEPRGCKGKLSYADCYLRKWNSGGAGAYGVNWCIGSRAPCLGCVQPTFPDGMSPFFVPAPTP